MNACFRESDVVVSATAGRRVGHLVEGEAVGLDVFLEGRVAVVFLDDAAQKRYVTSKHRSMKLFKSQSSRSAITASSCSIVILQVAPSGTAE